MKKVLVIVTIIMAVVLMVIFSPKETANVVDYPSMPDEVAVDNVVAKKNTEEEYIDLSSLKFEVEEVSVSPSTEMPTEVTDDEYQPQEQPQPQPIWNRYNSKISTEELVLVRDGINKLIYDINLAIELDGSYPLPGGRNIVAGDVMVTAQMCGLENNSFNIDHEFQNIRIQHHCFIGVFRDLMSSSIEYKDAKNVLKKLEEEMLEVFALSSKNSIS